MSGREHDDDDEATDAVPETDTGPEVWRLSHPRNGDLEVAVGGPAELRTIDTGFAGDKSGFAISRDGVVLSRVGQYRDRTVSIDRDPPEPGTFDSGAPSVTGPRVKVRCNALNTAVRQVTFLDGKEVVHFDPPPGSAAEARLEAIAASPWKRVLYPIAGGIGKSGWAIAAIVLLPLLGRVVEPVIRWLAGLLPEFSIPWPDIPWPDISWPEIPWPDVSLPSIDLPEVTLPEWVEFLLEYSKVWVPLVIGVAVAVVAVRHAGRSRRLKAQWQSERREQDASQTCDDESSHGSADGTADRDGGS